MALIKCPECGKEISNRAVSCIYCGFPLSELDSSVSSQDIQTSSETSLDKGTQRKTTENELPSLTQCTA